MNQYTINTTGDTLYDAVIEIYDNIIEYNAKNFHVLISNITSNNINKLSIFTDILKDLSKDMDIENLEIEIV